jgi:hypothetical protein
LWLIRCGMHSWGSRYVGDVDVPRGRERPRWSWMGEIGVLPGRERGERAGKMSMIPRLTTWRM